MKFKNREFGLVSFGEMIMRLSPINNEILIQAEILMRKIGGAEYNVGVSVSNLGEAVAFLTKIPDNSIGEFVKKSILSNGISTDYLIYDSSKEKRIPIYYYEYGLNPRTPQVAYDRAYSSFQNINLDEINNEIFQKAKIFHTSGISLGLSKKMENITKNVIKKFKENETIISFDVNFRKNLWSEDEACATILPILEDVDILFASEETLNKMFKQTGNLKDILRNFAKKYRISIIASTQRVVHSPKNHSFSSLVYDAINDIYYSENPYENIEVIDRIGSGDAYCGGFLFGLLNYNNVELAMKYGNANSVVKNTIIGDVSLVTKEMIKNIIDEHASNNKHEMSR